MEDECEKFIQLWGEIEEDRPTLPDDWNKNVLNNLEQDVIISSVQPIYFKESFYCNEPTILPKQDNIVINDPYIKRTVKMMKHRNDLRYIAETENIQETVPSSHLFTQLLRTNDTNNDLKSKKNIILFKDQSSAFTNGIYTEPPLNLSEDSTLNVLRSCVGTILAFTGFSETTIVPLQLLTEVVEEYIRKMVTLLHVNVEKESLFGETGFSDVLDRTCHEMGIGCVRNLANYFKEMLQSNAKKVTNIKEEIRKHERVVKKLREEKRQFSELSSAELDDENSVVPELHVTSFNSSEMASEPFEAGLQILQTLERQQLKIMNSSGTSLNGSNLNSHNLTFSSSEFEEVTPIKKKRK